MPVAAARRIRNPRTQTAPLRFDQRLILNQWMLSLFEVNSFEQLAELLKGPDVEGKGVVSSPVAARRIIDIHKRGWLGQPEHK
jgi:hypothetical protein